MSSTVFARKMRIAKAEREKELDEEQLHRAEKELDGLIFAAYSAQEEQNYQEAVGFYTRALTIMTSHKHWKIKEQLYDLYYNRASCSARLGKSKDAIGDLTSCISIQSNRPPAYIARGVQLEREDAAEDALIDFERALAIEPNNADYYCIRAAHFVKILRYHKAIEDCDRVIRSNPRHQWAHIIRGDTKKLSRRNILGSRDEEIFMEDYSRALEIDAAAAKRFIGRGFSLKRYAEFVEAVDHYVKSMSIRPKRTAEYRRIQNALAKAQERLKANHSRQSTPTRRTRGLSLAGKRRVEFTASSATLDRSRASPALSSSHGGLGSPSPIDEGATGPSGGLYLDQPGRGRGQFSVEESQPSGGTTPRGRSSTMGTVLSVGRTVAALKMRRTSVSTTAEGSDPEEETESVIRRSAADRDGHGGRKTSAVTSSSHDSDDGDFDSRNSAGYQAPLSASQKRQSLFNAPEPQPQQLLYVSHRSPASPSAKGASSPMRTGQQRMRQGGSPRVHPSGQLRALGINSAREVQRGGQSLAGSALIRKATELFDLEINARDWKELSGLMADSFGCDAPANTMYNANDYAFLVAQNTSPQTVAWRCSLRSPMRRTQDGSSPLKRRNQRRPSPEVVEERKSDATSSRPSSSRRSSTPNRAIPRVIIEAMAGGPISTHQERKAATQPNPDDVESSDDEGTSSPTRRRKASKRTDEEDNETESEGGDLESSSKNEDAMDDSAALLMAARKRQKEEQEEIARKRAEEEEERRRQEEEKEKDQIEEAPDLDPTVVPFDDAYDGDSDQEEERIIRERARSESRLSRISSERSQTLSDTEKKDEEEVAMVQALAVDHPEATISALMWNMSTNDLPKRNASQGNATATKREPGDEEREDLNANLSSTDLGEGSLSRNTEGRRAMASQRGRGRKQRVVLASPSGESSGRSSPKRSTAATSSRRGAATASPFQRPRAPSTVVLREGEKMRAGRLERRPSLRGLASFNRRASMSVNGNEIVSERAVVSSELAANNEKSGGSLFLPLSPKQPSSIPASSSRTNSSTSRSSEVRGFDRRAESSMRRRQTLSLLPTSDDEGAFISSEEEGKEVKREGGFETSRSLPAPDIPLLNRPQSARSSLRKKWMHFPSSKEKAAKELAKKMMEEEKKRIIAERRLQRQLSERGKLWKQPSSRSKSPRCSSSISPISPEPRVSGLFRPRPPVSESQSRLGAFSSPSRSRGEETDEELSSRERPQKSEPSDSAHDSDRERWTEGRGRASAMSSFLHTLERRDSEQWARAETGRSVRFQGDDSEREKEETRVSFKVKQSTDVSPSRKHRKASINTAEGNTSEGRQTEGKNGDRKVEIMSSVKRKSLSLSALKKMMQRKGSFSLKERKDFSTEAPYKQSNRSLDARQALLSRKSRSAQNLGPEPRLLTPRARGCVVVSSSVRSSMEQAPLGVSLR